MEFHSSNLLSLPALPLRKILNQLDARSLDALGCVCKKSRTLTHDGSLPVQEARLQRVFAKYAVGGQLAFALNRPKTRAIAQGILSLNLSGKGLHDIHLKQILPLFFRLTALDLHGTNITNAAGPAIGALTSLTRIDLGRNILKDAGLESVCANTNLRHLGLAYTHITAHGLSNLTILQQLEVLDLSHNDLQGPLPEAITKLPRLQSLHLYSCKLNPAPTPQTFCNMFALRQLDIGGCQVNVDVLATLPTQLQILKMDGVPMGEAAAHSLGRLAQLRVINANFCGIGDRVATCLAQLPQLENAQLAVNHMGNLGAFALAKSKSLRRLNVATNNIGPQGMSLLRQQSFNELYNCNQYKF